MVGIRKIELMTEPGHDLGRSFGIADTDVRACDVDPVTAPRRGAPHAHVSRSSHPPAGQLVGWGLGHPYPGTPEWARLIATGRYATAQLLDHTAVDLTDAGVDEPIRQRDEGEPLADGAAREAFEEVGVRIDPADLLLATVVHHRQRADLARVGMFFATSRWVGEPYNAEPDKCGKLLWCDPSVLPTNTIGSRPRGSPRI